MRISVSPPTDPAVYPFRHRLRTRFAETDAMGIVHHGAYLPYLEEARIGYLRSVDQPYHEVREGGLDFTVVEAFVQYRRPLHFDEEVDVHVDLAASTRTTIELAYLLTVDDDVRATAVTVHGVVDRAGRPRRLPEWVHGLADH